MHRRKFIQQSLAASTALYVSTALSGIASPTDRAEFSLPPLPYKYNALEPYIDAKTMEIHYSKHHDTYIKNLNKELTAQKVPADIQLETLLKNVSRYNTAIRNNAGGHYNHSLLWSLLSPTPGAPSETLANAINRDFQSYENFIAKFNDAAKSRFGSGWVWLVRSEGKLSVVSTPNQDNPLMDVSETQGYPVLGLDVWEHAYYLKYQNNRAEYINAFWKVLNWTEVNKRFAVK